MAQRKVRILKEAIESLASVSYFIESKGMPSTAKKFVDSAITFFHNLGSESILHRPCLRKDWNQLGYRCATFKKKFTVAYLDLGNEVLICDFAVQKNIQ